MSGTLSDADFIEINRVLFACASFGLWERWLCAQPPAVARLLNEHSRACAAQARVEAEAAAQAADRRRNVDPKIRPSPMRAMKRSPT